MSKKCLFIFNPYSGRAAIKNHVADIVDIIVKAGYETEVYPTQGREDATKKVGESEGKYDHIVASGGDGTLNEVISGMMKLKKRPTLGYIPMGSTNDFANSLNISSDVLEAAETAVNGSDYNIDIGIFNKRPFVYIAAFGAFTEVSYSTSQDLKNFLGHQAYLLEGIKQLAKIREYKATFDLDGEIIEGGFLYAMITNATSAGGFKGITGKDVSLNDGVYEVMLVKKFSDIGDLNDVISVLTGLKKDAPGVIKRKASRVKVYSTEDISWTIDGEYAGSYKDVEISIENCAVSIKS